MESSGANDPEVSSIPRSTTTTPRRHRRTSSGGEMPASSNTGNTGNQQQPFPTQISYTSFSNHHGLTPQRPPPTTTTTTTTTTDQSDNPSRNWLLGGGAASPFPYPPYPYGPFPPSPYGSPYAMMDPVTAAIAAQRPHSLHTHPSHHLGRRPSSSNHSKPIDRGHKRSHSFGGAPTYGSLQDGGAGPPMPARSTRNPEFSPRNEFIKLTGSHRRTDSTSSAGSGVSPRISPRNAPVSPFNSSLRGAAGGGSFPLPPEDLRVSFSGDLGVYDAAPPAAHHSRKGSSGGEAVFMAQKKSYRQSSSRQKKHMRQKSAQLFMEDVKGQEQTPACRDIFFLMIFAFHLLGIVYLGNTYGYEAGHYHQDTNGDVTIFYSNITYLASLGGLFAIVISALALALMMAIAKKIVQVALVLAITLSFVWGTIGIGFSPRILVPATGFVALLLSVAYAFIVWDRIPFVASNLDAGLHGIRSNLGLVTVAFLFQALALGWTIYYLFVVVGVYDAILVGDIDLSTQESKSCIYFGLGISYYWTIHVLLNVVEVTVAGLIGKWWFTPDGDISTRRADLNTSCFRAIFYEIGSICYGSLFVGPVRLLRQLSAFFRPNEEGSSSLLCLHECLFCIQSCMTSCVDNLADRYSPWSFTYVGLYGYGLVEAGQSASDLFDKRGWSTIVSDDLAPNVLLLTSLVIGGVTGLFTHLIENAESLALTTLGEPGLVSFFLGAAVGLVASSVLFGIIVGSVNTVIVCFAASPVDFEQNHPKLSHEMRSAWREVWPGCMDVVDMRVAVASYLDPSMITSERSYATGEHQALLA